MTSAFIRRRAVVAAAALLLTACSGNGGSDPGGGPDPTPTGDPVAVYVTTAGGNRLLGRDTDVHFRDGAASGATGVTVLAVDTTARYQEMVGFGASLTDASAYLIQTKLNATQREALLQELFGRTTGLGFSFTRLDM